MPGGNQDSSGRMRPFKGARTGPADSLIVAPGMATGMASPMTCSQAAPCHGLADVRRSDARVNQRGQRIDVQAKLTIGCLHIAFCGQVAAGLSHVLAGGRSALT